MELSDRENLAVSLLQRGLPLVERPFDEVGKSCGMTGREVVALVARLLANGDARRLGGVFDARRIGFCSALCRMTLPEAAMAKVAEKVCAVSGVTHAYERGWPKELPATLPGGPNGTEIPNFWFTLAAPADEFASSFTNLRRDCAPYEIVSLPASRRFKIDVVFNLATRNRDERVEPQPGVPIDRRDIEPPVRLSESERKVMRIFQDGLDPEEEFFATPAQRLGMSTGDLLALLRGWQDCGVMRRLGLLLNHRKVGILANGMCCWRLPSGGDGVECGRRLAACPEVTHCYERPAREDFPYAIYAMVHTPTWEDTHRLYLRLSERAGLDAGTGCLLFSLREFKKTSMRFF